MLLVKNNKSVKNGVRKLPNLNVLSSFLSRAWQEPTVPIEMKSIGMHFPKKYNLRDYKVIQEIVPPETLWAYITKYASIKVELSDRTIIETDFATLHDLFPIKRCLRVTLPPAQLKEIARNYALKDWRLCITDFDPFSKNRPEEIHQAHFKEIILGLRPQGCDAAPACFYEFVKRRFKTNDVYLAGESESIIEMMTNSFLNLTPKLNGEAIVALHSASLLRGEYFAARRGHLITNLEEAGVDNFHTISTHSSNC